MNRNFQGRLFPGIVVLAGLLTPSVGVCQVKKLQITTTSLPSTTVGSSYQQSLSATGGTPPLVWTVSAGALPGGLILSPLGAIAGIPLTNGTSQFTVKVQDLAGNSDTQALQISVVSNPVITTSSLPDATAGSPYSATLAQSGAVPPVTWSLSPGNLPAGLTLNASTGAISGTPSAAGAASFTVKLTDSGGGTATKPLSLTVKPDPPALQISTNSLPPATAGTAYSQPLAATGGSPPYTWSISTGTLPAGLSLSTSGTISGTPSTAGTASFTVKATDSASASATAPLSLVINPGPLKVTTSSLPSGTVGTAYSQPLAATGGSPPYAWTVSTGSLPAGLSLGAGGTISGTPTTAGSAGFTVKVTDSASVSATAPLSLAISPAALKITTSSLPAGTVGTAYSQPLAATGGSTPYTWTVSTGSLPAGLSLSPSGTISGTPTTAGTASFTVKATDSASVSATAPLSLAINPSALRITTSSLPAGTVGTAYSQSLAATGGSPPYTWTVSTGSLPAGLSLSASGTISGMPTTPGTASFTVKATDSASVSATAPLSLAINPAALQITTSSLSPGTVGTAYSQPLAATGGSPPYTWTVSTGSLPAGLSLSAGGTISGTPTTAGTVSFTVKATDSASVSATAPLSLVINPAALHITTSSLPGGTVGTAYSQPLAATGGSPPYTWSVSTGSLPAGLNLSAGGTISGTPTNAGTANFTVKATDSASVSATAGLSLTINPPGLGITTSSLPPGTVGTAYSQPLAATGGSPPYTWSVSTGSLPAGLNLSASGTISGTPTTAGTANFTVKATDSASVSATAGLSLTINPPGLGITTSSLPPGTVGTAYSQPLAATGGSPPYTWSVSTGSLPAGLNLSAGGTISGTPTSAGTANFTVKATDSASVSATAGLSLTINPPGLGITTSSLPPGTVGTAYSQPLAATGGSPPYTWSVSTGSLPAGLNLSASGTISGTPTTAGTANFTVKATDSASVSATAGLSLTINPPGLGITTSSLPPGTVGTAYSQPLAATGGSPPYTWSVSTGSLPAGLNLSATGTISGTPTTAGTANFTVKTTDSASVSATAGLSLTINAPGLGVTTSSLPPGTVGTAYSQSLAATGGSPPYTWSLSTGSLPAGLNLSASGTISGTPTTAGMASFTVKATDSASVSATAGLSLTINPPGLGVTTSSLPPGTVGTAYSQSLAATGGSPPYTWSLSTGSLPAGLNLSASGTISGTPTTAGMASFTVKATDSASVSATASLSLVINAPAMGITTSALPAGTVGTAYSQTLAATGGSPPYSWSLAVGALPAGLNLSAAGTISGTPANSGLSAFAAQVADSTGAKANKALTIQILPQPVLITTTSLTSSTVGVNYSQSLSASGGSPPYSWSVSSGTLPPGLTLDPSGAIRGASRSSGSYTFALQVADSMGVTAIGTYLITVNGAVTIQTSSLSDALIGAPYSQTLRASGGTLPYTWSVASGALPDGITLDTRTGSLAGTPTIVGSFNFTLRVVDSVNAFAENPFQITTAAGLIITTAPILPPATVSLQYALSLNAAGGKAPYIWSISSGGLPAGVTLNAATGALGGVPSIAGSFQFTVDVTDSSARKASKPFSLTVAASLVISSAPQLPPATAGTQYTQSLAATGGIPPYLWNITSGGLPAGLSFDAATAALSGIASQSGTFTFTAQVTDSNSVTASKQFTLAVISNLVITTASPLPDAVAGSPYARTLNSTGGVPPYVWAVAGGSLPPGLTLDPASNSIVGTPTASGSFAFTLQVADASGASVSQDYMLLVTLPPLPSVSIDGLPDPANPADQPVFSVSLATAYPVQLTGQIVMTFTPDAVVAIDDPAIQFAAGGRTMNFTIPPNASAAAFSSAPPALQTGTVAGTITLNLSVGSAGGEVTATATRTLHVNRAAPVTRNLLLVHTASGFELHVTAYSTPRQLTQAVVQLTPSAASNLQTTQLTIPLADLAGSWYQSAASSAFGSQFTLVLPFTIQGNAAGIDSVSLSLANDQGNSPPATAKF